MIDIIYTGAQWAWIWKLCWWVKIG